MITHVLKHWKVAALIVVVAVSTYAASLDNQFVDWDDYSLILHNPILQELSFRNIWLAFTTYDPELYIPFTLLSYHVDRLIAGGDFHHTVTHVINLILHIGNALAVCWLVGLLTGKKWLGAVAGVLFSVHPLTVEAVAWASARKDLLAALFCLTSWGMYLRYRKIGESGDYKKSLLLFAASLFSKVSTVVLPVVLLLTDWLYGRPINRENWREKAPYFFLSIVFGVIALLGKPGREALYFEKTVVGARSVWLYLQHFFVPTELSLLYPLTESVTLRNPELLWSVIGVVAVTILVVALTRVSRWPLWIWGTFILFLVPSFQNFTRGSYYLLDIYIGSDRYTYLAMVALLVGVVFVLQRLYVHIGKAVVVLLAAAVGSCAVLTYQQSLMWQNTGTLFVNVMEHYPNSHVAHMNVGVVLKDKGYVDLAEERFKESINIRPNEMAYFNLAQIERERGNTVQARVYLRQALDINPHHPISKINLASILLNEGRAAEALTMLDEAESAMPNDVTLLFNKGVALETLGRLSEALEYYKKALQLAPGDEEIHGKIDALEG